MKITRSPTRLISAISIDQDIPMATYKLTGLGAGSGDGHSVRYQQLPEAATIAHKASDKTMNNDDTLANDADLVLAVGANEVWSIHLILWSISGTTTPDIDYLFAVPSGGAIRGFVTWNRTTPAAFYDMTSESLMQVLTTETVLMQHLLYIGGGTAGNLQLQWAQHIATVEDTKMKAHSVMLCHKLA